MKKIDIKDEKYSLIWEFIKSRSIAALEVPQKVESAVFPIYYPIKVETKPEQIGSGVLVVIKQQYFIFSASHVFDPIGTHQLLIGAGDGGLLLSLKGDRFSSKLGPSGNHSGDPIDASVFHIQSKIPENVKKVALTLDDMELEPPDSLNSVHMLSGFRASISRTKGKFANANREAFPSSEIKAEKYSLYNCDYQTHILLAYEDDVLVDDRWQLSPRPKGMSGGAIIKISGISITPTSKVSTLARQVLSGICIAHRRDGNGLHGVLIGTRVIVHLHLIAKYMPEIFD